MHKNQDKEISSWFIGPKGEHGKIIEEFLLDIWRDYIYWRRNYFPQDGMAFKKSNQKNIESDMDKFNQTLMDLLSKLKRNFPFHSPRYIAHMTSESIAPAVLGYFAGMLYNANNVSPEGSPVTAELEIEATNEILKMLGYNPSPEPPKGYDKKQIENYEKSLKQEFGWAHIVPGGSLANLEALWVASLVKYSAINIKYVCKQKNINIAVNLPNGNKENIINLTDFALLTLKPNESIDLLKKFITAVKKHYNLNSEDSIKRAHELLNKGKYSLNKGIYNLFSKYPPIIFVSKAAHYSIDKSASILGIGKDNVIKIEVDSNFRININDLKTKLKNLVSKEKKIPIAVIAIAGTTEEGAVDPIDKLIKLRKELEKSENISFWLHIDAAWGGYLRTLIKTTPLEKIYILINKLSKDFSSINDFINYLSKISNNNKDLNLQKNIKKLLNLWNNKKYKDFLENLKNLQILKNMSITLEDKIKLVQNFTKDTLNISYTYEYIDNKEQINIIPYEKKINIMWGDKDILSSFIAFPYAESITIDPHKLGYIPYPCGMIAYRNDRIRHFIMQKVPYITSSKQDEILHNPPRHWNAKNNKIEIDAFGPYIIEGSRPGASATSLWLSIKNIPLNKEGYGLILKNSLLAARELYEWLKNWDTIMTYVGKDTNYKFIPLTANVPDTNIVIFTIKPKNSNKLIDMNNLTKKVYTNFTIQAELGEQKYIYSQPFFLSKTIFEPELYSFKTIEKLLNKDFNLQNQELKNKIKDEYQKYGLFVLRATVMNPYIYLIKKETNKNLIKEFVKLMGLALNK